MLPKLVITDIDGVWTDGGMYYTENGDEFKKFNTADSAGVLFCKLLSIPTCIMTGENAICVERRSKKLKIDYCYLAAKDKLRLAKKLCLDLNISLAEVAFIGDDINDLELLEAVGLSASVPNAPDYIKKRVDYIASKPGGSGAFRDFIEEIIRVNMGMEEVLAKYKSSIKELNQ